MQVIMRYVLLLLLLAGPLAAQDSARVNALRLAYADWLVAHRTTGTGAIAFQGKPAAMIGDAISPVELASVSKSITALCAAVLSDAGQLDLQASVRDVLGRGPDVSVASLITHSSGIVEDITQVWMPDWLDSDAQLAETVLGLMDDPAGVAGQYAYNNVNYALLGLVIEASSGGSYEDVCHAAVLEPAGASGTASPRSGGFLSWGGWAMSPMDYARVHSYWFGPKTATGRAPLSYPHVRLDKGLYYGLGTLFRKNHTGDGSYNFWHFGALCFPGKFNVGAYAVTWGGQWTAVVGYDACVDFDTMLDLDARLGRAAYGALP